MDNVDESIGLAGGHVVEDAFQIPQQIRDPAPRLFPTS